MTTMRYKLLAARLLDTGIDLKHWDQLDPAYQNAKAAIKSNNWELAEVFGFRALEILRVSLADSVMLVAGDHQASLKVAIAHHDFDGSPLWNDGELETLEKLATDCQILERRLPGKFEVDRQAILEAARLSVQTPESKAILRLVRGKKEVEAILISEEMSLFRCFGIPASTSDLASQPPPLLHLYLKLAAYRNHPDYPSKKGEGFFLGIHTLFRALTQATEILMAFTEGYEKAGVPVESNCYYRAVERVMDGLKDPAFLARFHALRPAQNLSTRNFRTPNVLYVPSSEVPAKASPYASRLTSAPVSPHPATPTTNYLPYTGPLASGDPPFEYHIYESVPDFKRD